MMVQVCQDARVAKVDEKLGALESTSGAGLPMCLIDYLPVLRLCLNNW
jgi:hypothetical protein